MKVGHVNWVTPIDFEVTWSKGLYFKKLIRSIALEYFGQQSSYLVLRLVMTIW
jgi:hypothetical protein